MPRKSTTPSFSEKDIPDLKGYVIIVTGGNSGIGYETSFQLAKRGARVYIGGRSIKRVEDAIDQMNQAHGAKLDIRFLRLDLNDLK
ncbi:hypothetical protein F66182_12236 [Fusarium sp. NRRL 66182]|nr:hypothetical protein F66182_12236 [Fusarium sp. NRRL 66182]